MARKSWFVIPAALMLFVPLGLADPPEERDDVAIATLKVQAARAQAKTHLLDRQPAKAVEVLEQQLPYINGSREYLMLLRDAYRNYIVELQFAQHTKLAEKYATRLKIIEDGPAAENPARLPVVTEQVTPLPTAKQIVMEQKPAIVEQKPASVEQKPAAAPTLPPGMDARGKFDDDPFHPKYEIKPGDLRGKNAQALVSRAEAAFGQKNYLEARQLFEQAHQSDPGSTTAVRDNWAYAKLSYVVEQINKQPAQALPWTDLETEVKAALAMSSLPRLEETGKLILSEIQKRRGGPAAGGAGDAAVSVKHLPRGPQGWEIAETSHFRIYHQQSRDLVEKVARIAEQTRVDMSRKWFGKEGETWTPKCEIFLHATGQDYQRATEVPASSPGHSRIETDPSANRVVSRRVHLRCDNPTLLSAVLPHETTHVVIAGQYGPHPVPRWADEGVAVLTEPAAKVNQHRKNLHGFAQRRELFQVQELIQMQDYPQPARIGVFYAQSVSLVDFLCKQRDPQVFSAFLRDGLREGYEPALRKHYGMRDFADLQSRWNQHLATEMGTAVAGRQ